MILLIIVFCGVLIVFSLFLYRYASHDFLCPQGAALINMDDPLTNVINSLFFYEKKVKFENILRTIEPVMHRKEFSCRVFVPKYFGWPYFVPYENYKVRDHIHVLHLEENGDDLVLQRCVARLIDEPLDLHRPLWRIYLIHGYKKTKSVLLMRFHHCLMDGVKGIQFLLGVSKSKDEKQPINISPKRRPNWFQFSKNLVKSINLLFDSRDTKTILFTNQVSGNSVVSWCDKPINLTDVKKIAKQKGVTVNDVLLYCLSGSIRHYFEKYGQEPKNIRSIVFVNTRNNNWMHQKPEIPSKLSVDIGTMFVPIPVCEKDPIKRSQMVHKITNSMLHSAEPFITKYLIYFLGLIPKWMMKPIWNELAYRPTLSMSNVIGPQYEIEFGGERVEKMFFFTPPQGKIGVFICIVSYFGKIFVGCVSCKKVLKDPNEIVKRFSEEIDMLIK